MGTLGTFDSFTTARLGIYAAQHGIKVTGNNISNINTAGYTRQRIDQVSFKTGVYDRYHSMMDNHIGSGALVTGISQIRDPYLDIRYRCTSTDTSYYDSKLAGLQEIASILDEVGKGVTDGDNMSKGDGLLYAQLQKLSEQLRAFSADPTTANDTLVRKAAESLTSLFNKYADRLEKLRQDYEEDFNNNVTAVNKILTNIRDLNKSIRECEINGDNALEMRDERNRQIDDLAQYMSIKVQYSMEDVGAGVMVEKLTILMGDSNPDPAVETDSSMLVDGLYCTQLSVPKEKPVVNPFKNIAAADKAEDYPDYPDFAFDKYEPFKDYLFLSKVTQDQLTNNYPAGATFVQLFEADGTTPIKDADGNDLYLVGTNDPTAAGIITEENDNYTVQLSKLLDTHNEEWKSSETTWTQLAPGAGGSQVSQKAVYQYQIGTDGSWAEDGTDTFQIGNQVYTVGKDLPLAAAKDPVQLAAFIAAELNKDPARTADYAITSNGDNIVFTAKKAGAVGPAGTDPKGNPINQGPDAAPTLTLTPNAGKLTMGTQTNPTAGQDSIPPTTGVAPDNLPAAGTVTDPATGTEIATAYREVNGAWYQITIETKHTREVALDDNDLHGELQAQRELLTGEGEFASAHDVAIDENAAIERGIPYYQKSFDLLAQKFAEAYNQLNQGYMLNQDGNYVDKDGNEILLDGKPVNKYEPLTPEQKAALTANPPDYCQTDKDGNVILDEDGNPVPDLDAWLDAYSKLAGGPVKMGGPLFSNRNDGDNTSGITASNISVSHSWTHGAVNLIPKYEVLFKGDVPNTTQNTNADHMVTMIDKALTYNPQDLAGSDAIGPLLFEGSFNDMFSNLMGVQASDASMTNVKLVTSATTLVELDSAREGVSGVDLNDEAMNMMQYQKAYSAACRLMTVIDEALDRLINNTGVVGR